MLVNGDRPPVGVLLSDAPPAKVDAKVDAIITDDPEALVAWLRDKKLHP